MLPGQNCHVLGLPRHRILTPLPVGIRTHSRFFCFFCAVGCSACGGHVLFVERFGNVASSTEILFDGSGCAAAFFCRSRTLGLVFGMDAVRDGSVVGLGEGFCTIGALDTLSLDPAVGIVGTVSRGYRLLSVAQAVRTSCRSTAPADWAWVLIGVDEAALFALEGWTTLITMVSRSLCSSGIMDEYTFDSTSSPRSLQMRDNSAIEYRRSSCCFPNNRERAFEVRLQTCLAASSLF
jgi:hypothetical protein